MKGVLVFYNAQKQDRAHFSPVTDLSPARDPGAVIPPTFPGSATAGIY